MSTMFLPILLCLVMVPLAFGIHYQDMEFIGKTCPGRDKCEDITSSINGTRDFRLRNCECDSACVSFGDCCVDVMAPRSNKINRVLKCVGFGNESYIGAYMVVDCPARAERDLKRKCEAGMDLDDPFMSAPVTTPNGATYANAYCAACRGAALDSLIRWDMLVEFSDPTNQNFSSAYVWRNLKRDDQGWGVELPSGMHDVRFFFDRPANARNVRLCRRGEGESEDSGLVFDSELVSECPRNYSRALIREACASYTAVVYKRNVAYRNPHCALCNGVKPIEMVCDPSAYIMPKRKEFTFAHLFDVSGNGDVGTVAGDCTSQQKYDPASKRCRNLVCGIPGRQLRNGRCQ